MVASAVTDATGCHTIPLAYILVGGCMIAYGIVWQPVASVTALATIGAGAAVYHVWLRPRAA